jgi:hypothetical protein
MAERRTKASDVQQSGCKSLGAVYGGPGWKWRRRIDPAEFLQDQLAIAGARKRPPRLVATLLPTTGVLTA